ncbi:Pirin family protein [Bordetella sputigena]
MIERRALASLATAGCGRPGAGYGLWPAGGSPRARPAWGALRAWRDETLAPGAGYPAVVHRDMEIITCVREGVLTHEDDMGNRGRAAAGDVQVMSAGSGLTYAEFNMEDEPARVQRIWIEPDRRVSFPSWGRKSFPRGTTRDGFVTLASGIDGDRDALPIRSDARVVGVALKAGEVAVYRFAPGSRRGFLVASSGRLRIDDLPIHPGADAVIRDESSVRITCLDDAEALLLDMRA